MEQACCACCTHCREVSEATAAAQLCHTTGMLWNTCRGSCSRLRWLVVLWSWGCRQYRGIASLWLRRTEQLLCMPCRGETCQVWTCGLDVLDQHCQDEGCCGSYPIRISHWQQLSRVMHCREGWKAACRVPKYLTGGTCRWHSCRVAAGSVLAASRRRMCRVGMYMMLR